MVAHQSLVDSPAAFSEMIITVDYHLDNPKEIVIVTPEDKKKDADRFIKEYRKTYLPNKVLIVLSEGIDQQNVSIKIPLAQGKVAMGGKTTAYVCEKRICKLPTTEPKIFAQQIAISKN